MYSLFVNIKEWEKLKTMDVPKDYRSWSRATLGLRPFGSGPKALGKIAGGGLPMGFNRTPHYTRNLLLVGDAGTTPVLA